MSEKLLFSLSSPIYNTITYWKKVVSKGHINKIKAYEQLVLLGFAITSFTPVAYQRHRL